GYYSVDSNLTSGSINGGRSYGTSVGTPQDPVISEPALLSLHQNSPID
ncbi:hypothetical protein LCGC14_2362790, partial [marine sediment metagenome]